MTLDQMADKVCRDTGRTDSDAKAHCKLCIRDRYQLIYDDQLWKESLFQFTQAVDPTATNDAGRLAAAGQVLLPALVDKLIAVRTSENAMGVVQPETFYRANPDIFGQTGTPWQFFELSPVVAAFGAGVERYLWLDTLNVADNNIVITVIGVDSENTRYSIDFTVGAGGAKVVKISNFGAAGTDYIPKWLVVESVLKKTSTGAIGVYFSSSSSANDSTSSQTFLATDTQLAKRARIQLVRAPTSATTLRVLCKKKLTPLINDADSPELAGVENILMAFARADMTWFAFKAQDVADRFTQEAMALLDQYKMGQVWQRANANLVQPVNDPTFRWDQSYGYPAGFGYNKADYG